MMTMILATKDPDEIDPTKLIKGMMTCAPVMGWQRVDTAAKESIDESKNYLVVTNAGEWGDQCLSMKRGWTLILDLNDMNGKPGRTYPIAYAEVTSLADVLAFVKGDQ